MRPTPEADRGPRQKQHNMLLLFLLFCHTKCPKFQFSHKAQNIQIQQPYLFNSSTAFDIKSFVHQCGLLTNQALYRFPLFQPLKKITWNQQPQVYTAAVLHVPDPSIVCVSPSEDHVSKHCSRFCCSSFILSFTLSVYYDWHITNRINCSLIYNKPFRIQRHLWHLMMMLMNLESNVIFGLNTWHLSL